MERIERLSTEVVNRIAAGEVIHRPANALKELLENSLDAGSTQINVTVAQGGLALLQIQDNGKGIHKEDLAIVCERFTTSKLRTFEDLRSISSFGFRGEALASISHVAHVTITSKTADQPCAFKASYRDGKLVAKQPGGSSDPVPCAGKNGTQIVVEDLFYNLTTRKQALKNTSEQYQRILDVVQKYAIHYGSKHIGFVCKKHRDPSCDVNTLQASSQLDVIRLIYGSKLANELLAFEHNSDATASTADAIHSAHGYISNANYNMRKSQFILFINGRLVDCPTLKRACEYVYSLYLPKHTHPFVYLSLELPPEQLDVNVHPTKREVHFLHEQEIIDAVSQAIETQLKGSNTSRTFSVIPITSMVATANSSQPAKTSRSTVDPEEEQGATESEDEDEQEEENSLNTSFKSKSIPITLNQSTKSKASKYQPTKAPQRLVRTDHRSNTLDKYYFLESQRSLASQSSEASPSLSQGVTPTESGRSRLRRPSPDRSPSSDEDIVHATSSSKKRKLVYEVQEEDVVAESEDDGAASDRRSSIEPTQSPKMLSSVQNLLYHVERKQSKPLDRLFREHTFVGVVNNQFSLVQFRTKLYLVRHQKVAYHLFYEKVLRQFGSMRPIKLRTPMSVYQLVFEALGNPRNGYMEEDGPRDQLAQEITDMLVAKGPMLAEYFCIDIDQQVHPQPASNEQVDQLLTHVVTDQGMLRTLPRILKDHEPSLHSLPEFVFQLATDVQWDEEEPCFENVAQILARWYGELRYPTAAAAAAVSAGSQSTEHVDRMRMVLEHVLFPAIKHTSFSPPHELNDASVVTPVACLTHLYKIFERC